MKRLSLILALLAAVAIAVAAQDPLRAQPADVNTSSSPERLRPELGLEGIATPPFRVLQEARRPVAGNQVRIERRVIIRISPSSPDARARLLAALPNRSSQTELKEVEHDDCVEVDQIAGVQPAQDNRLLLFMHDRRVLTASLERSCTARSFYAGFYVERSEDGNLCIARDRLQSRAGASCQIDELHRLVAAGE